ncbi:MAG: aminotransferase class I/II-fold pyridoxal phosphate-dependent enzyme, partial [Acidimicrobiales bacterium]
MSGYHSPQVDVDVRLNTNECPHAPPVAFLEELGDIARNLQVHRYPDREATALRGAVARHHNVSPDRVFCANGSNEVLKCLLLAYGGPGRRAAVFEPTYALHSHIARLTGTEVVAGRRDRNHFLDPDEVAVLAREQHLDVAFVCTPNNPTGNAEPPATVSAVAQLLDGLVIVDEAYAEFSSSSSLDLLESHPHMAVVRTLSKTWALAALRIGYVIGDPE